jgi:hypothetical protein
MLDFPTMNINLLAEVLHRLIETLENWLLKSGYILLATSQLQPPFVECWNGVDKI